MLIDTIKKENLFALKNKDENISIASKKTISSLYACV